MNELSPAHHSRALTSPAALVVARLRRGVVLPSGRVVGERDRTAHLFPLPTGVANPDHLTALCGLVITPGMADLLPAVTGMPCPACLARAAHRATG